MSRGAVGSLLVLEPGIAVLVDESHVAVKAVLRGHNVQHLPTNRWSPDFDVVVYLTPTGRGVGGVVDATGRGCPPDSDVASDDRLLRSRVGCQRASGADRLPPRPPQCRPRRVPPEESAARRDHPCGTGQLNGIEIVGPPPTPRELSRYRGNPRYSDAGVARCQEINHTAPVMLVTYALVPSGLIATSHGACPTAIVSVTVLLAGSITDTVPPSPRFGT